MTSNTKARNIYEMFNLHGGAGFFVKHRDWTHPEEAAQVISIGGVTTGRVHGTPPLYIDGPNGLPPRVRALVSFRGERPHLRDLSRAGTQAYKLVERPDRWPAD